MFHDRGRGRGGKGREKEGVDNFPTRFSDLMDFRREVRIEIRTREKVEGVGICIGTCLQMVREKGLLGVARLVNVKDVPAEQKRSL